MLSPFDTRVLASMHVSPLHWANPSCTSALIPQGADVGIRIRRSDAEDAEADGRRRRRRPRKEFARIVQRGAGPLRLRIYDCEQGQERNKNCAGGALVPHLAALLAMLPAQIRLCFVDRRASGFWRDSVSHGGWLRAVGLRTEARASIRRHRQLREQQSSDEQFGYRTAKGYVHHSLDQ